MPSSGSSTTWLSVFEERKQAVNESFGPGYGLPGAVCSIHAFRDAIEVLDKRSKKYNASRLEAKLLYTYNPITHLCSAITRSNPDLRGMPSNDNLEALVWWTSFALIKGGWKAGADLDRLSTLVADLNKKVPLIVTDKRETLRFPNDKRVQRPLQEIYSLFLGSHMRILSNLTREDAAPVIDPTQDKRLQSYISEIASKFEAARGTHDIMVNQAADDEARQESDRLQPSLDAKRALPDLLHKHSKSNREIKVDFISTKHLGLGSFGEVDHVRESTTNASYARKHIHFDLDGDRREEVVGDEVRNEVAIMQKLRHLHIATVLFYLKEDTAFSIFMLPVADCNLNEFMKSCSAQGYPAGQTKLIYPWFGCLLDALAYAHKLEIRHQDIKPSNILIKNNQPYLTDFGLAKDFADSDNSASDNERMIGTYDYRAPEGRPRVRRGRKADVFSLGCLYSEMISVYHGRSAESYLQSRLRAGSTAFRHCLPAVKSWLMDLNSGLEKSKLSEVVIDAILCMVRRDPGERHSAEQALKYLKPQGALFCVEQYG
ncbi:MAG: hypothetical protein Q9208_008111 [Pyrenodesmia sp. 3 TL-2023]